MRRSLDQYKWVIWAIMAFSFLIVFFHRYATAVVADNLIGDLGLTGRELSTLASMYFYAYALMQIPSGILADFIGPRRTTTSGMLLAGLGSLIFSLTPSRDVAYLGRLLVGLGVAVVFVSTLKMQSVWFRTSEFATASGLTSIVGNFGGILATTPLAILVVHVGWRSAFRYISAISFLVALLLWWLVRDHPDEMGFVAYQQAPERPHVRFWPALKGVIANRYTWPNFLYLFAIMGSITTVSGLWGVPYLMHTYGLMKQQASHVTLLMTLGVALGGPAMGWVADRLGRVKPILLTSSIIYTTIWAYILYGAGGQPPLWLMHVLFFLLGFLAISFLLTFNNVRQINHPAVSGIAISVVNAGGFVGTALLNTYVGRLLDRFSTGPVYPLAAYRFAFSTFVILGVIAVVSTFCLNETASQPGVKQVQT